MYRDRNSPIGIADAANSMGLFSFSDIKFYSADAVTEFSCENGLRDLADPFLAKVGIAVVAIEVCNRKDDPIGFFWFIRHTESHNIPDNLCRDAIQC